ncbi:MAG: RluA family pseudouridine synthase [Thermaerobacter sp.]|nr:RluA family pseudouridine synthase [Thermaerobacter sp.]
MGSDGEVRIRQAEAADSGVRLDRALFAWWPDRSRTAWQRAIAAEEVILNGQPARASTLLKTGDAVTARLAEPTRSGAAWDAGRPVDARLIVHQDPWMIVVNKPRGLVTHPARGHWNDSLVHRLAPLLELGPGAERPGVVHRLDRDTTGLMVVARTEAMRRRLSEMIARREVSRHYLAVVRGHLAPPAGVIDAPLARDPRNRLRMAVVLGGRESRTHFRTVALWPSYALLQCGLETGRTHQIRVHLSALGHPVLGDPLYGGHDRSAPGERWPGQLLHAAQLAFHHPVTGEALCFVAPLPLDWRRPLPAKPSIVDDRLFPKTNGCPPVPSGSYLARVWDPASAGDG